MALLNLAREFHWLFPHAMYFQIVITTQGRLTSPCEAGPGNEPGDAGTKEGLLKETRAIVDRLAGS